MLLKTASLEPKHGWATAKRIQHIPAEVLPPRKPRFIPPSTDWNNAAQIQANWTKWKETEIGRLAKFCSLTAAGRARLGKEAANRSRLSASIWL